MVLSHFLRYQLLRNLVEVTYTMNGNASVHLLSHSLGGPYTNLFLVSYVSTAWKAQYIASHIQLSSPIMGSVPAIEGILSGPMYDYIPQFLPSLIVPAIRSFPSIAWMFPRVYGGFNAWGGGESVGGRVPADSGGARTHQLREVIPENHVQLWAIHTFPPGRLPPIGAAIRSQKRISPPVRRARRLVITAAAADAARRPPRRARS